MNLARPGDTVPEHTPGPWRHTSGTRIETANGRLLALLTAELDRLNPADARLMAGAPEILAALKEALAIVERVGGAEAVAVARQGYQAIAKATGVDWSPVAVGCPGVWLSVAGDLLAIVRRLKPLVPEEHAAEAALANDVIDFATADADQADWNFNRMEVSP